MNLDWERLSLSGYFEALEANNEAHAPDQKPDPADADFSRLKRAMAVAG
ncbi:hypothetical protein [Sphingobium yanoikuyae]|nr:hypothetical protein [Sphingobium yanoikuyae]